MTIVRSSTHCCGQKLESFYDHDPCMPFEMLNRIVNHALFDLGVSDLQSVSCRFWNHLVRLEVTIVPWHCQVRNCIEGVGQYCDPKSIETAHELSPRSERPLHGCFGHLMDHGIHFLVSLHCSRTRSDDDTSAPYPLLRNAIALEPCVVFHAVCADLNSECDDSATGRRDFLVFFELLSLYTLALCTPWLCCARWTESPDAEPNLRGSNGRRLRGVAACSATSGVRTPHGECARLSTGYFVPHVRILVLFCSRSCY